MTNPTKAFFWPACQPQSFDPQKAKVPRKSCWFKPFKFNQAGYDAVYIESDNGLVRFVQVTQSKTHSFGIEHFAKLLNKLVEPEMKKNKHLKPSDIIKTIEIFFVVEKKTEAPKLQLTPVTGQGSLECYGWQDGEENRKVRIVSIECVNSWSQIDW
ncbi:hypothetical protein THRCLA_22686 [Thraustotheca clavata]|uniref:Uncharacterized protein n=1 Tax=Thraustotheca clavata TaxID=74557 RepID=A0A1V9YUG9_9STRA|nr:hypothetical protein THRCLA_22686 [Thraustotheca clavata]